MNIIYIYIYMFMFIRIHAPCFLVFFDRLIKRPTKLRKSVTLTVWLAPDHRESLGGAIFAPQQECDRGAEMAMRDGDRLGMATNYFLGFFGIDLGLSCQWWGYTGWTWNLCGRYSSIDFMGPNLMCYDIMGFFWKYQPFWYSLSVLVDSTVKPGSLHFLATSLRSGHLNVLKMHDRIKCILEEPWWFSMIFWKIMIWIPDWLWFNWTHPKLSEHRFNSGWWFGTFFIFPFCWE